MTWYAVYTNVRSEFLAAGEIFTEGYRVLNLRYWDEVRHARRKKKVLKPYFPRYIFAELPDGDAIYSALHSRGVHSLVSTMDGPLPIEPSIIDKLAQRGKDDGIVEISKEYRQKLQRGQRMRLLSGAFAGFYGTVCLDNGSDIALWLDMLGRKLRVSVAPEVLLGSPTGR